MRALARVVPLVRRCYEDALLHLLAPCCEAMP